MPLTSIHPLPASTTGAPASKDQAIRAPTSTVYEDDSVSPLATINITRTLAAKLCGRVNDVQFNAHIIALTQRMDPFMHGVASIFLGTCLSLFFIANVPARNAMSFINAGTGVLVLVHGFASLSWDMLCLIARSFEFWFLIFINTTNNLLWLDMFRDERNAAMVVTGASYVLSLCADANIYTRRFATRLLVIASPGLLFGLTITALRFPPDLTYPTYRFLSLDIDGVDLLVNGNLIISFFTAIRVMRSQHLVLSTGAIRRINCDMYFPVCRLVAQTRRRFTITRSTHDLGVHSVRAVQDLQQLELIQQDWGHHIDASAVLAPWLAASIQRSRPIKWLNWVGTTGFVASLAALLLRLIELTPDTAAYSTHPLPLSVLGFATSLGFVVVHALHYQRTLFKRVCLEIDAWFVAFQATCVAVGSCDLMAWDPRRILLILTAWVWSVWIIFVDALPPITRRRLAFPRRLALLVTATLLVYPLLLGYWLYFSPARAALHNRVLLDMNLRGVSVRADMLGFLASKLFMLWVWMGRFFWRELLRPSDAFKLIKHRVFYRVGV